MKDESHLPYEEQSLVFRLRKRAEIRRQIPGRLAVTEGKPDKIANLLDEAADEIERLRSALNHIKVVCSEDSIPHEIRSFRAMREARAALGEKE